MPGMFCDAMATMNSGMPMLMGGGQEKLGVVHSGTASSRRNLLKSSWPSIPASSTPTSSAANTA